MRADAAQARRLWNELQPKLDVTKLIFFDETPDQVRGRL